MAAQFNYFSPWRSEAVHCQHCYWKGTVESGSKEMHGELMGYRCPNCQEVVAIIRYPTLKELATAAARGNMEAAQTLAMYQRELQ